MTPADTSTWPRPHSTPPRATPARAAPPLIELRKVRREFPAGDEVVVALKDVSLTIESGEMVAIVGASGSGKSTLMNVLGCLDRPTSGAYRVFGRDTRSMAPDDLAALRREHFGFIFQRYHLLSDLTAAGNVETPAIYLGREPAQRRADAKKILARLGLKDRAGHTPNQLSGGQQQRVSIARALINGGEVILADEPTGALDTTTGEEVMRILRQLNSEGRTIIIVTHDAQVADHADRIIELRDGEVVADNRKPGARMPTGNLMPRPEGKMARSGESWRDRFTEAFRMAIRAMRAHKLRTFLTMLGIIIGIAAVVSVVALGEGSRKQVLSNISALGTNTIDVRPGTGFGDRRASATRTLTVADADAIAGQSYVDSVTPTANTNATLRRGNVEAQATVNGVGDQFFRVRGMKLEAGSLLSADSISSISQEIVIDPNTRSTLFPGGENPIGEVILVGKMPARIVGVASSTSTFGGADQLNVYAPYTSVMRRLLGQDYLRSVTVRVKDDASMDAAQAGIVALLTSRHGSQDFYLNNSNEIRDSIEQTTGTMTLLIASIAIISLIVGGIGVMNIMLVSVTERVKEIGVRMAVGARQADIMQQFLIEAVLVCMIGGALGVALALSFGVIFPLFGSAFQLDFSISSIVLAFLCSTLIGITFGFLPARSASKLDPIEALARE
ncbi:MAG: MacB family efflux pump subunit [Hyphomonadaceae bacterium]|nr:MacB family efflux pump subunit [Hyphomonadaceae bacterium]